MLKFPEGFLWEQLLLLLKRKALRRLMAKSPSTWDKWSRIGARQVL